VLLLVKPAWGLVAFWNIVIPIAPAWFVFAPGLWRNVCPLATTSLAARKLGLSARRQLSPGARLWLNLAGVIALFVVVLWRRFELNTSAPATAIVLAVVAGLSVLMGMAFEWKSGWCSGLCPVHPVEKLYGSKPLLSFDNAHCEICERCSNPCPDSTAAMHPLIGPRWNTQIAVELLTVGAFPGLVWGWFHMPDWEGGPLEGMAVLRQLFLPVASMAVSLAVFAALRRFVSKKHEITLVRGFAAAAVCCYYWYRVPGLLGFGYYPDDGVLIDLRGVWPAWWVAIPRTIITALFCWWLLLHSSPKRPWAHRPPLATSERQRVDPRHRKTAETAASAVMSSKSGV